MEQQKTLNLLNEENDSKFVTGIWNIVNDLSNANYNVRNEFIYSTEVLKSNLSDYNDAQILVKGDNTVTAFPAVQVSFRYFAPFAKCSTKIDRTIVDDAEDLDLVIPVRNLIEYSSNYSETPSGYGFITKMKQLILM